MRVSWAERDAAAALVDLQLRDRSPAMGGSRLEAECGRCGFVEAVRTVEAAVAVAVLGGYGWVRTTGHGSDGWLCDECPKSRVRA